jgi:hypothetical protein
MIPVTSILLPKNVIQRINVENIDSRTLEEIAYLDFF